MLERPKRSVCKVTQVRRFLKRDRDERGVASTVGTIMALLVFLTFLTLFTNSYIPVWMVDNERTHMNTVMNQFGEMKGKVDILSINARMTGSTDINMYQSIDLGADGIPVFASPTAGMISYAPYGGGNSSVRVIFNYTLGSSTNVYHFDQNGGGMVQFYAPNRYYVQQWVTYENGAILVRQTDGQTMRAYPSIELSKPNPSSQINMAFEQVDFVGPNSSAAGTSNAGLNIDVIYLDSETYTNANISGTLSPIVLVFKSLNGQAWYSYLFQYLHSANNNLVNNTDYVLSPYSASTQTVKLVINNVSSFAFSRAITQISVEVS
ncbi:MAG: hypothetical protein LUQ39_03670 [Methanomassiliicoccales archaeon]|nr:hypothetical protein [Methanomassiliicoccales archaeon]